MSPSHNLDVILDATQHSPDVVPLKECAAAHIRPRGVAPCSPQQPQTLNYMLLGPRAKAKAKIERWHSRPGFILFQFYLTLFQFYF